MLAVFNRAHPSYCYFSTFINNLKQSSLASNMLVKEDSDVDHGFVWHAEGS